MSNALRTATPDPAPQTSPDPLEVAADLARRLGETANARDQAGGHAAQERGAIRASGLLTLSIPAEFGGQGADVPLAFRHASRSLLARI